MTRSNHGALLLLVGLVATGCSAGGGDGVQSRPAVCSSIEGLQAAVTDLRNVDVSAEGVAALQAKVGAVGADVQQVAPGARVGRGAALVHGDDSRRGRQGRGGVPHDELEAD